MRFKNFVDNEDEDKIKRISTKTGESPKTVKDVLDSRNKLYKNKMFGKEQSKNSKSGNPFLVDNMSKDARKFVQDVAKNSRKPFSVVQKILVADLEDYKDQVNQALSS